MNYLPTLRHPGGFETIRFLDGNGGRPFDVLHTTRVGSEVKQGTVTMDRPTAERYAADLVDQGYKVA